MKFYENLSESMKNLSERGAFLTVTNADGTTNTMTISWGYIGFSWERPMFITMIRPQRFTSEVIQNADSFTISIPFSDEMKKALMICGSKSGRDTNKLEAASIEYVPAKSVSGSVVAECDMYYECKIRYCDPLNMEKLNEDIFAKFYKGDSHDFFFGEIVDVYGKANE